MPSGSGEDLTDRALLDGAGGRSGASGRRRVERARREVSSSSGWSAPPRPGRPARRRRARRVARALSAVPALGALVHPQAARLGRTGRAPGLPGRPHGMGTVVLSPVARSMSRRSTGRTQTTCSAASSRMTSLPDAVASCGHATSPRPGQQGVASGSRFRPDPEPAGDLGRFGRSPRSDGEPGSPRRAHGHGQLLPGGDLVGVVEPGQVSDGRRRPPLVIHRVSGIRPVSLMRRPSAVLDHGHEGRLGAVAGDQVGDVGVGDVGEPDPDRFGDPVDADVPDAGQGLGDLVAAGAAVPGTGAEDQADLVGLGEPQRDPGGEQVAQGDDLLARVLHRPDHADPDRAALGEQQRQGGGDPLLGVPVGDVGGQRGELVDQHHDQRLVDGRGVQPGDPAQARPAGGASPRRRPRAARANSTS